MLQQLTKQLEKQNSEAALAAAEHMAETKRHHASTESIMAGFLDFFKKTMPSEGAGKS
jgi:hypothetical protein